MHKIVTFLAFTAFIFANSQTFAQTMPQSKEADIARLMVASGASAIPDAMAPVIVERVIESIKQSFPNLSEKELQKAEEEAKKAINDGKRVFTEAMTPVYNAAFSHDEILDMIAFLESKTGRKLVAQTPAISAKLQEASVAWGRASTQNALATAVNALPQDKIKGETKK